MLLLMAGRQDRALQYIPSRVGRSGILAADVLGMFNYFDSNRSRIRPTVRHKRCVSSTRRFKLKEKANLELRNVTLV